ncbi:FAD-binding domain-containing protein [Byssothecium circinans]|uniref:FAD-binding domain-containing protein n=1 Tax=Byssothecium circinans TaxID=147558 RepID=A0A6A5TIT9_9PLEO|nr:FAD-binding domain-containing protein [Byssothecium circinans]
MFSSPLFKGLLASQFLFKLAHAAVDTSSLSPLLSPGAVIDNNAPRWSEYEAPHPGAVVHPATEADVQKTVKWAIDHNITFLTQNGGNGWVTTFDIECDDIIINLDLLRSVAFNDDKTQATVAGGALISDVIQAASSNSVLVATGSCNCVGFLGAVLGGGLGVLQGEYGLGVDELLSLNVVDANGNAITVTPSNKDLWFALRGAAPNFGIVTSATVQAHPVPPAGLTAWTGALIFTPPQLEAVIAAAGNLSLTAQMALTLTFANAPATNSQSIVAAVWYYGTADAGRAAFKSLLDIGPVTNTTTVAPYTSWNNGSNNACVKGGRRPTWGAGLQTMDPAVWRQVFDVWRELALKPGAERSSILVNAYSTEKVRSVSDASSAVPWRRTINFHAQITAFYTDPAFDSRAISYGQRVRELWRKSDKSCRVYINNALGDESKESIYGIHLRKLTALKRKYDPHRRFAQWFPL